jgi:hypothetical protein
MECQRGKVFEHSEFFPSNGMEQNFSKIFAALIFWVLLYQDKSTVRYLFVYNLIVIYSLITIFNIYFIYYYSLNDIKL